MSKVIAIGNNKGGVAKTTTAVNLAKGLADAGKKVLLIDSDPQGNATTAVGYDEPDEIDDGLASVMKLIVKDEDFEDNVGILHNQNGFDILPGNIELSEFELFLVNTMDRERIMKRYIDKIAAQYDYVIIDCASSLGLITTNAFVAADSVIIPLQASYMSLKGLVQLIKHITRIRKHINYNLEIEGILVTMVDGRYKISKDVINVIHKNYGENVRIFSMPIPRRVSAEVSVAEGITVMDYEPSGSVAEAYRSLTDEVLADER